MTYNCIPPSDIAEFDPPPKVKRTDWDCSRPIMDWLLDTPAGQAEYRAVYARALKEVFGLEVKPLLLLKVKPEKDPSTGQVGYHILLYQFTDHLYGKPPSTSPLTQSEWDTLNAIAEAFKGGDGKPNTAAPVKKPLLLEATIERAFLHALNRKATEADMKAVIPVFEQERATFSRMVEILKGFDSLKNIK